MGQQAARRLAVPIHFTLQHGAWEDVSRAPRVQVGSMRALRLLLVPLTLLVLESRSFELQDTIHALIEENIHLHDQLENLTQALRELKRMLRHHSNDGGHHEHHSEDAQHVWEEWSQHGISAETHELLENALCGHGPHDSASSLLHRRHLLLMLLPPCLLLLLLADWLL